MAKHNGVMTAATIRENMERRFSYLYTEEHYNGQDAVITSWQSSGSCRGVSLYDLISPKVYGIFASEVR
jgi:hypothetical protein